MSAAWRFAFEMATRKDGGFPLAAVLLNGARARSGYDEIHLFSVDFR